MKPMLSFHYKDHMAAMPFPCYMQPKLDGIRLLYQNGVMQSRSHGKEEEVILGENRLIHIRAILVGLPDSYVLDGELYVHGWSRQQINGAARVRSLEDGPTSHLLEYHVFDLIKTNRPDDTFERRCFNLYAICTELDWPIKEVCSHEVHSYAKADELYHNWKKEGYEGAMYKHPDKPYGFSELCGNKENRWKYTLKRKDWLDGEFECLGAVPGDGKYSGCMGALVLITKEGKRFNVGSGFTDDQREYFAKEPPCGELIHIRYDIVSDEGIPIQPRFDHIIE